MKVTESFFFGVAGWCAVGTVGIFLSLARGRLTEAYKHALSLAVVAGMYLLLLLSVSLIQKQKVIAVGQDQCFQNMCFAIVGIEHVPSLVTGDDAHVERVSIRVTNRGSSADADTGIEAYLLDSRGRLSEPLAGLSGNRLNGRLAPHAQMLSQPMFRVAKDSAGLGIVLTHGSWQRRRLTIGDSDSLAHRRTIVALGG